MIIADFEPWKDHVATYVKHSDSLETLQWKNPESSHFAIWYVRQHGALMVWGDLGAAVYRWYPDVNMRSIANTNLDYFVSKCEASEDGRKPYRWDSQEAEKDMREYFAEIHDEERNEEASRFEQEMGWGSLGEDEHVWVAWLRDNAEDVFGQDWWEHPVVHAGQRLNGRTKLHHEGLKQAMKQLEGICDACGKPTNGEPHICKDCAELANLHWKQGDYER